MIDLPVGFMLEPGSFAALDYTGNSDPIAVTVTLMGAGMRRPEFESRLRWRVGDLSSDTHVELRVPMLIGEARLGDAWLVRTYEDRVLAERISSEVHLLLDDLYLKVSATSHISAVDETEEQLKHVALQLLRKTGDPASAGLGCSLGPVVIAGAPERERIWLRFSCRTTPGVEWTVFGTSIHSADALDHSLGRWNGKRMVSHCKDEHTDVLLTSYFRAGGKESQEILTKRDEGMDSALLFFGETCLGLPGLPKPHVSVRLAAHCGRANRSWSEDKALALWHAVLASIRPRNGAS